MEREGRSIGTMAPEGRGTGTMQREERGQVLWSEREGP